MRAENIELLKEVLFWFLVPVGGVCASILFFRWMCRAIAKGVISEEEALFKQTKWIPQDKPKMNKPPKKTGGVFVPTAKWNKYSRS
jgi:phosphate/sulfate permease